MATIAEIPSGQFQPLINHCRQEQEKIDKRMKTLVEVASVVAAVIFGIIFGAAMGPIAGIFLGIVAGFAAHAALNALAEKNRNRSYEKAALALNTPDFVEFSQKHKISLNADTILSAHEAFVKALSSQIKNIITN